MNPVGSSGYMHWYGDITKASVKFISGITLVITLYGRTRCIGGIKTLYDSTGLEFTTISHYPFYSMFELGLLVPLVVHVNLEATGASGLTG